MKRAVSCFPLKCTYSPIYAGLPLSGKNIWKMKFVPGQGILWMAREI